MAVCWKLRSYSLLNLWRRNWCRNGIGRAVVRLGHGIQPGHGGARRRYHLHESHVQKAIHQAAGLARIAKRVTAHTFRHTFASHLLLANYDIRTIQEMLGHADIATTQVYTHVDDGRLRAVHAKYHPRA